MKKSEKQVLKRETGDKKRVITIAKGEERKYEVIGEKKNNMNGDLGREYRMN